MNKMALPVCRSAYLKLISRLAQICLSLPKLVLDTCPHQHQRGDLLAGGRQLFPHQRQLALEQQALLLEQLLSGKKAKRSSAACSGVVITVVAAEDTNVLLTSLAVYTVCINSAST
ncbi:hypothetical protein N7592_17280 [Pseudomonas juntendi]|uniref:Uncharacterized protein n=1 Tax=Pseudomonas juntendi TaxID=2666183 RepID=A0ABZ2JJC5_9PSED|nr:hypothetical protein [Pseudomonas juntendi]MDG9874929.1 hypothetical protein [Pseudomonas juntendi]